MIPALLGCAEPAPSGGGALQLAGDPFPVGGGPSRHHGTVALAADGTAFVAWAGPDRSWGTLCTVAGTCEAVDLGWPPSNHPQVRAHDEGWLVVATVTGPLGLAGTVVGPAGDVAPVSALVSGETYLPDLDTGPAGVRLVWSAGAGIGCATFARPWEAAAAGTCPTRQGRDASVGSVTVRTDGELTAWAWAERDPAAETVWLAVDGAVVQVAETEPSGAPSGRPALAVSPDAVLVVWRGEGEHGEASWLRAFARDLEEAGPVQRLGEPGHDVGWPTLAGPVDGVVLAAWAEDGGIRLQARDAGSGAALGEPVAADTDPAREARRPSVDLVAVPGLGAIGLVAWEDEGPDDGPQVNAQSFVWSGR